MNVTLYEHRCPTCRKLLVKGVVYVGTIQIKCLRCKSLVDIAGAYGLELISPQEDSVTSRLKKTRIDTYSPEFAKAQDTAKKA